MAIWLIRAGSHREYEQIFITENRDHLRPFQQLTLHIFIL